MLKVLGEHYYFDLDKMEQYINVEPTESSTGETPNQISVVKYELIKLLTEVVLTDEAEVDETLGMKATNDLGIPFKLAFNTLLNKQLINKY